MSEYPKMLYRAGSAITWEGMELDTFIVEDAEGLKEAAEDGWVTAQSVASIADEKTLLDESVPTIEKALPALSDDELLQLLDDEEAGKTRATLIKAIKDEIERR